MLQILKTKPGFTISSFALIHRFHFADISEEKCKYGCADMSQGYSSSIVYLGSQCVILIFLIKKNIKILVLVELIILNDLNLN